MNATATLSATLPATPLPPEPGLGLLYLDHFDTGNLFAWILDSGWSLVPSEGGQALQGMNSDQPLELMLGDLYNTVAQARFVLNAGVARITVRQSAVASYSTTLDSNGQVLLYRGDMPLATATVTPSGPGQWRPLRLSAIGDVLRVTVDGAEVIVITDNAPLPPGRVTLAGDTISSLLVDDFYLWIPMDELLQRAINVPNLQGESSGGALAEAAQVVQTSAVAGIAFVSTRDHPFSPDPWDVRNQAIYVMDAQGVTCAV